MGEVLIYTSLDETCYQMSELFDKEVNAQKEFEKNFQGSRKLMKKCVIKMKRKSK